MRWSSKLYSYHPFSWFLLEIGAHLFKIHHKQAPSVHGAAANLSYQVGVIFQKEVWKYILKRMGWGRFANALMGHIRACLFNPRLTGGGGVWRPLPNIRDSSKTNSAIDMKLGRPSHTTIWHRPWIFFWNPSEIFWDVVDFVTSLHVTFGRKLAKLRGSVEDAVFNENANGKHQKT